MEKWRLLLKVVLLLTMGTAAVAWSTEVSRVEEKTFKMSADGSVSVIGDEGCIEVKGWDKEEVYLKMTKRAWGRLLLLGLLYYAGTQGASFVALAYQ